MSPEIEELMAMVDWEWAVNIDIHWCGPTINASAKKNNVDVTVKDKSFASAVHTLHSVVAAMEKRSE